jgi:hypothetical protein
MLLGAVAIGALAVTPVGVSQAAVAPEHGYVTNSMQLPTTNTQAANLGRDVDGNGTRDNRLGQFFASLAGLGFDLPAAQSQAIATGEVVMLHSLRAPTLTTTTNATWQVWYDQPTPSPNLTGTGTFTVSAIQPHSPRLAATIKNHHVQTAAGSIPVLLDLGGDPFELPMTKAKIVATCEGGGCTDGKLTGVLTKQQINDTLIPGMVATFNPLVQRDCPGPGPTACMADSTGKTVQAFFDTNDDMVVTEQEVKASSSFLKPDLDLVKANGAPGKDGVKDAISFGFGFTTRHATLVRP